MGIVICRLIPKEPSCKTSLDIHWRTFKLTNSNKMPLAELKEATNNALEAERERFHVAQDKVQKLRTMNARLKEKNQKLREQYHALLALYNELAEEARDASDSSSSEDSDDGDDNCSIM